MNKAFEKILDRLEELKMPFPDDCPSYHSDTNTLIEQIKQIVQEVAEEDNVDWNSITTRHMTKKECNQLYYINREIKMWERELNEIRNKSYVNSPKLTGMPIGTGASDKTAERSMLEMEYEKLIENLKNVAMIKRNEIMQFIETIEISSDRQIVFLRAAALLPWSVVAEEIGGDNTEDSVRKRYERLFNENNKNLSDMSDINII